MLRLFQIIYMGNLRPKILSGTGSVVWNTRFSSDATILLTGNVILSLEGVDDGKSLTLLVTQDAVGGRTPTITPLPGTTNRITSATSAINATAAAYTQITILNISGRLTLTYFDPAAGGGGTGPTGPAGRSIQVFTSTPAGSFGVNYFAGDIVML